MKKLALPILLVFALSTGVFAQNARSKGDDLGKTIEAAIQKADKKAKSAKRVCVYCGEEIISNGQHCSANSYSGLCSDIKENSPTPAVIESECDHCGTPAVPAKKAAKKPVKTCVYCGEEIISNGQHCSANSYNGLCSDIKENTPAPAVIESECDHCGTPAVAIKKETKKPVKTCVYCGEEIISNGQHCSANSYSGLCSDIKENSPTPAVIESECDHCGGNSAPAPKTAKASLGYCDNCGNAITKEGQLCEERGYTVPCVNHTHAYKTWHGEEGLPQNHKPSVNAGSSVKWKSTDTGRCPDCGRTPEQIRKSGHNHK